MAMDEEKESHQFRKLMKLLDNCRSKNTRDRKTALEKLVAEFRGRGEIVKVEVGESYELPCGTTAQYLEVFNVIFRCASDEQAAYSKATTGLIRKAAENRLDLISDALRLAIEGCVQFITYKVVIAILNHVLQMLMPSPDELFEPTAMEYSKCARIILSFPPHVEHLNTAKGSAQDEGNNHWVMIADFCIGCVQLMLDDCDDENIMAATSNDPGASRVSKASSYSVSVPSQGNSLLIRQVAAEMTVCLQYLTSVPNAPVLTKTHEITRVLIHCLRSSSLSDGHRLAAFTVIKQLLLRTRTEDIRLTELLTCDIVPIIRKSWPAYSAGTVSLRDELLKILVLLRPYIFVVMKRPHSDPFRREAQGLIFVLESGYTSGPSAKLQLNSDDLCCEITSSGLDREVKTATLLFSLRSQRTDERFPRNDEHIQRTDENWMLLCTLATIYAALCDASLGINPDGHRSEQHDERYDDGSSNKRQRRNDDFSDLLTRITSGELSSRLLALKTLLFYSEQYPLPTGQIASCLERLQDICAGNRGAVASWSFFALASLATQNSSASPELAQAWDAIWHVAMHALTDVSSCRGAAFALHVMLVMNLVTRASVNALVQTVTNSIELAGPAVLVDSVGLLLPIIVEQSLEASTDLSAKTMGSVAGWFCRAFNPSRFVERTLSLDSNALRYANVMSVICSCLGQKAHVQHAIPFPVWDATTSAWMRCESEQDLIDYLLLFPMRMEARAEEKLRRHPSSLGGTSVAKLNAQNLILTHLTAESARINEAWQMPTNERIIRTSTSSFSQICRFCCVAICCSFCCTFRDIRRQKQLQEQALALLDALCEMLSSKQCRRDMVDVLLVEFSSMLSGAQTQNGDSTTDHLHCLPTCEKVVCVRVSKALDNRRPSEGKSHEGDEMDIETSRNEDLDSRPGFSQPTAAEKALALDSPFYLVSRRCGVALYAKAVSLLEQQHDSMDDDLVAASLMTEYIVDQPQEALLACSGIIAMLPCLGLLFSTEDVRCILDRYATNQNFYSMVRSDVAISSFVDIILSFKILWNNRDDKQLYELSIQSYQLCTSAIRASGSLSPASQKRFAAFLLDLCQTHPDYVEGLDLPSPRTSLFGLLHRGCVGAQFFLASRISSLFSKFTLSAHDAMFDDLQSSLPAEAEWIEGIAMRLLYFSELASVWHSLLRRCVYYLFETAGRVQKSLNHAARCISKLAQSLPLKTPQKLFSTFASQLLHTWLETSQLSELPFAAFQYASLGELLAANESEVCAQLLMRNAVDDWSVISKALKMLPNDIIKKSFAKCLAYAIGRDITKPQPNAVDLVEQKLREAVGGKETHRALISQVFPTTMGYFYLSMQLDDLQESWLEKRTVFAGSFENLKQIKRYSHSVRQLPPSQQPSFRSKYLCDQIERLCRRVGADPAKPWTSSSFMLAARMLIDAVEPSLGPLHACLVIRRMRVLIAMSGDVAYTGLPLEMLIHFLRSFVSNSECADDALGILQYLFDRGIKQLQTTPKFFTGAVILLILQIRQHSRQEQESTTLESQHRTTVERMLQFQGWLVDLFTRGIGGTSDYAELTAALGKLRLPGNSRKDSAESQVMLFLLQQWFSGSLCSRWDCSEAVGLLSQNFEPACSTIQECLGDDDLAVRYSPQLLDIALTVAVEDEFRAWIASVLGRSYTATGKPPCVVRHAETQSATRSTESSRLGDAANSVRSVASRLTELVYSQRQSEAGLAEFTLRSIAKSFSDATEILAFEQALPQTVQSAVQGGTFKYEPTGASESTILGAAYRTKTVQQSLELSTSESLEVWAAAIAVAVCTEAKGEPVVNSMTAICANVAGLALEMLPPLFHILLTKELGKRPVLRDVLSKAATSHLLETDPAYYPKQCFFLELLMYLRSQPVPGESTQVDRLEWLDVDLRLAASAGARCGMPVAALLLAESINPLPQPNRRISARPAAHSEPEVAVVPHNLLLEIFSNLEEPDSFYGVKQAASLAAVLGRFDYEKNGMGSLMLRAAQMDSRMRTSHQLVPSDLDGVVQSLSALNLKSLTYVLVNNGLASSMASSDAMLDAARALQQWDVNRLATKHSPESIIFDAFQELSHANSIHEVRDKLRGAVTSTVSSGIQLAKSTSNLQPWHRSLAVLSELTELLWVSDETEMATQWQVMRSRQEWMQMGQYEDVYAILSSRETTLAVLAENEQLSQSMHLRQREVLQLQVEALLDISKFARGHSSLQEAMTATATLADMTNKCKESALSIGVAAHAETAHVLWQAGEATTSIQILRDLLKSTDLEVQDIPVGRPTLLARLGHQLAEARLEKPEDILRNYLQPAIEQLKTRQNSAEAGQVYHEFAAFCHNELQSPGNSENFLRVEKLRNRKMDEVAELKAGIERSKKGTRERDEYERSLRKAKQWFAIDDAEFQRLKQVRDMHIQQSLQNYLLALQASDGHDTSVLRFFTLWLENPEDPVAGESIAEHLPNVPSWKFILLMNQLMSSLEHDRSIFQTTLRSLVLRICSEHPHHGLHHLFASSRRPEGDDAMTRSRYSAAKSIASEVQKMPGAGSTLRHVFTANKDYHELAHSGKIDKGRTTEAVKNFAPAMKVATTIPRLQVPPATLTLAPRPGCDYADVPIVVRFDPFFSIMNGLSAPKALKAIASDGQVYKQLFKSGNDDLRQDAIMEQVFEGVSKMLRNHRATRQRDLKVRTYKVIPLSTNSGIIEFVPNSIPINEFLRPAHRRYYPKDWSDSKAREEIRNVQHDATHTRVEVFRKVCQNMRPVLRHFFFERFNDPDGWFERRTAYTRTTASVSMLGHVLGLGDRHCHNILLDEVTGEIVHIDLGVAFEAGRVLPIPELVPFRLTRDIIDGMGITKTEGVFRRCCEFTMDALRDDKSSIMTLLDVLRYDPLYNWTVSPLRAKHMQDAQETGQEVTGSSRKKGEEAGSEADRALSVVEKKLSKTLSTAATVNELIVQATDERNLATLFGGWAAYF
jgi:ataxia telangiectasia mutated family protein